MFYSKMKWNESGFRPPLCTYRLDWARRTSWGWWDDWDDTVLQTQDSKFEPWRSEAEHATSRSRRLPTILTFTRGVDCCTAREMTSSIWETCAYFRWHVWWLDVLGKSTYYMHRQACIQYLPVMDMNYYSRKIATMLCFSYVCWGNVIIVPL